jgi:Holliday junction resolvase RusA-like endonuclease
MPKPKSWSKTRLESAEGKSVITKPDCDNIAKFYLDVLNGIAYDDDRQVSCLWCRKIYSDNPRVEIQILSVDDLGITDPRDI